MVPDDAVVAEAGPLGFLRLWLARSQNLLPVFPAFPEVVRGAAGDGFVGDEIRLRTQRERAVLGMAESEQRTLLAAQDRVEPRAAAVEAPGLPARKRLH